MLLINKFDLFHDKTLFCKEKNNTVKPRLVAQVGNYKFKGLNIIKIVRKLDLAYEFVIVHLGN